MSSGRLFNSGRASKEWERLVDDLIEAGSQKEKSASLEALKSRQGRIDLTINLAPSQVLTRDFKEAAAKIGKHLEKIEKKGGGKGAGTEELAKEMDLLGNRLLQRILATQTTMGQRLMAAAERKQRQSEKEYAKSARANYSDLKRKLSYQMLEISERRARQDSKQLQALHKDLSNAIKSLQVEDFKKFKHLEDRLNDVTSNYGVEEETASRLEDIDKYLQEEKDRKKESREKWASRAESAFDWFGSGPGAIFRGARSLYRATSKAASATASAGRKVRGVSRRVTSGAARVLTPAAKKGTSSVAATLSNLFNKDAARKDRENTSKREERGLVKRQVSALEKLTAIAKRGGAGGIGGGLLNGLKSLLGGMGNIGKGAAGIARALFGSVLGKLGLVGLAGYAGWKIGSAIYENYSEEIQSGIEAVVGVVSKAIEFVSKGFDWFKDFLSNPLDKIKKIGGKLKKMWDDSVFAKFFSNPGQVISEGIGSIISSTKQFTAPVADYVSKTSSKALDSITDLGKSGVSAVSSAGSAIQSSLSTAASTASNFVSNGFSSIKSAIGKLFNVGGNADVENLDPAVQSNFMNMAAEYKAMGGKGTIQVNSGFRSKEEQARLFAQNPSKAAPPGKSAHGLGMAIDINSKEANELDRMGLLAKYGFSRPVNGEPWHLQASGVAAPLAANGIFSADNPQNQGSGSIGRPSGNAAPEAASLPGDPSPVNVRNGPTGQTSPVAQSGGTVSPNQKVSASSLPSFSFGDNGFFMMNIGALGG